MVAFFQLEKQKVPIPIPRKHIRDMVKDILNDIEDTEVDRVNDAIDLFQEISESFIVNHLAKTNFMIPKNRAFF